MKNKIISLLNLVPHPEEGGYFSETYRCSEHINNDALPGYYDGDRCHSTAIYYLLTPDTFSAIHRLQSDEIFHFYLGDPVEMLQLAPDGSGKIVTLGSDIINGQSPQVLVEKNIWQGARLKKGGKFALLGCTVAPGFEFVDYEHGQKAQLLDQYPQFQELINSLT